MIRNFLVIARVSIDFDGFYGATEDYILGHSQSKMIADSYAATLNGELEQYKTREDTSEIITDYRFLWAKDIIDTATYEFYKNADEVNVSFVVVETESIDSDLSNVEVCKEVTEFADHCRGCGSYQGQILAELRTKYKKRR